MPSLNDLKKNLKKQKGISDKLSEAIIKSRENSYNNQEIHEDMPDISHESHDVFGSSIEACQNQAAEIFQVPVEHLNYEVIQKGSKGILGIGKKDYHLNFTVKSQAEMLKEGVKGVEGAAAVEGKKAKVEDTGPVDGTVRMVMKVTGAFLKVSPPKRGGETITFDDAVNHLVAKGFTHYNGGEVKEIIQQAKDEWIKIGEYTPNPEYDSKATIEISSDQMTAHITVSRPILSGRIMEVHEIEDLLAEYGIEYGIKKELITEILEEERFNVPVMIAEGDYPEDGKLASIDFHFKTDQDSITLQEDDFGSVNFFDDLGLIQNVVAGQILAVKNPPSPGKVGKTVTGEVVEAKDGEDVPFEPGKNTTISENGLEIIAQAAGRAVFKDNKIEVEPIYEVKGNVGLKTGSIVFLGDVIVSESIEDGFSVKAAGNVYIGGTIGKAEVEADGDIIVQRGILGKEEGIVKAGGNVIAKFIENSKVVAGNKVIAGEGILHSHVDAKSVYALGKRGMITGGHIRSVDEINAKSIGSQTYTATKVETGIDPVAKEKLVKFEAEKEAIEENLNRLNVNLDTLTKKPNPSPEQQIMIERMKKAKKEFDHQLQEINMDLEELRSYLSSLSAQGKVSAADKIYPGTTITIRNTTHTVNSEHSFVTFIIDGGEVKPGPYQEPRDKQVAASLDDGKKKKKGRK